MDRVRLYVCMCRVYVRMCVRIRACDETSEDSCKSKSGVRITQISKALRKT